MENKKMSIDEVLKEASINNYGYYYDDKFQNITDVKNKYFRNRLMNCSDFDEVTEEELEKARKRVAIMKILYDEEFEVKKFELDSDDCILKVEICLKE